MQNLLNNLLPKSLKHVAKAVVPIILGGIALLAQATVIDTNQAAEITTVVLAVATALGVHSQANAPKQL